MDPVILYGIATSALTMLGTEVAREAISEAGKDLWSQVKKRLGLLAEPAPDQLAIEIATRLKDDPALTAELLDMVRSKSAAAGTASMLIGNVKAERSFVAGTVNVSGNFNM